MRSFDSRFFTISFLLPFGFVVLGFSVIFFFVILPFISLDISVLMASPVVPESLKSASGFSDFSFNEFSKEASSSLSVREVPATFTISIPKLHIKGARVETNSQDLSPDTRLGHYKGTALPGDYGNSLIYGHSVIPVFYNPKDYKTIFSKLPELKMGDEFTVVFADREMTYRVIRKITQKPEDVNVFDSNPADLNYKSSTVTLLTCVPPGAKNFRLLVVGELIDKD